MPPQVNLMQQPGMPNQANMMQIPGMPQGENGNPPGWVEVPGQPPRLSHPNYLFPGVLEKAEAAGAWVEVSPDNVWKPLGQGITCELESMGIPCSRPAYQICNRPITCCGSPKTTPCMRKVCITHSGIRPNPRNGDLFAIYHRCKDCVKRYNDNRPLFAGSYLP